MKVKLTVKDLLQATTGELLQGHESTTFEGAEIDSRKPLNGKLFIALKGDKFDGHDFIKSDLSAHVFLVHKIIELTQFPPQATVVMVPDTLLGLQDLAHFWRKKVPAKFLAISGSNGKTTSKEFTKSVLSQQFSVVASQASFNNHWGVPLTLLNVGEKDDVAVIEMGMNHLGELKRLSEITQQDVSVVTNIGRAHMGEVGSFEKVIQAKKELYDHSPQALHIFNLDNIETKKIYESRLKCKNQMTFSSQNKNADVYLRVNEMFLDQFSVEGHIQGLNGQAMVSVFGRHNVYNVMVAAALGLACGMSPEQVWSALPNIQGAWGRSELKSCPQKGFQVIFDAYNANPESVNALIHSVSEVSHAGQKYFILGDMLELGEQSLVLHQKVIAEIMKKYDGFWYIGQHTESIEAFVKEQKFEKTYFLSSTYEEVLAMKFHSMLHPEDLVLIKGSRGMRLESILEAWNIK